MNQRFWRTETVEDDFSFCLKKEGVLIAAPGQVAEVKGDHHTQCQESLSHNCIGLELPVRHAAGRGCNPAMLMNRNLRYVFERLGQRKVVDMSGFLRLTCCALPSYANYSFVLGEKNTLRLTIDPVCRLSVGFFW